MKKTYDWDSENKIFTCTISYQGLKFTAKAKCHMDDINFASELTGGIIAEFKADIKYLKYLKKTKYKPAYDFIFNLSQKINHKKDYKANSYTDGIIRSELAYRKKELDAINQEIAEKEQSLKLYIGRKEKLYTKLREAENN